MRVALSYRKRQCTTLRIYTVLFFSGLRRRCGRCRWESRAGFTAFDHDLRGCVDGAAVFGFDFGYLRCGFGWSGLHQRAFTLADESQAVVLAVPIDANEVPKVDLFGSQQISQRVDHVAFDGPLQVSCTVALVGSFLEQEFPAG